MVVNSEFLHRCIDTQMFFFHGFYNHSLELRRISFVWYSFCLKNPEGFFRRHKQSEAAFWLPRFAI